MDLDTDGFELIGTLAWKVLVQVNKVRKGANRSNGVVAQGGERQELLPRLAIGARQGDARANLE